MTDHTALKEAAEAYFPEKLSVDYAVIGGFDNEKLYAFLMHGPKDDGDHVCVDENPDELDGPPSPRLEAIADIVNAFPALLAENEALREALGPFGELWIAARSSHKDEPDNLGFYGFNGTNITVGDLRRARALTEKQKGVE